MKTFTRWIIRILQYLSFPFVGIEFIFRYLSALSKSKHYVENPEKFLPDERFRIVYILVSRILYFKGIKIVEENWDLVPKKPVLFVMNHKSNIDPLIMIQILNNHKEHPLITFVAKKELLNKNFGKILRLIDVIFIDRNDIRQMASSIDDQEKLIRNNLSLAIFPEGTRISGNEIGEFKPGALKIAYRAFCPIVPVAIWNTQNRMDHNKRKELSLKPQGYKVYVRFLEPLLPINFINIQSNNVASNIQNLINENYLNLKQKHEKK
ncbi:lysophospholipid acyltransferase family protein [Mycoplasmoides pirum]|uniref:lysophospholipid acyltransferase family protein n=1 Tax=Mycoplasmoides pirum TaxID=2122 RepID=UPI00056A0353|nr:lysophospholipid acyltransferase family protein [Mycoplasmoides pirum]